MNPQGNPPLPNSDYFYFFFDFFPSSTVNTCAAANAPAHPTPYKLMKIKTTALGLLISATPLVAQTDEETFKCEGCHVVLDWTTASVDPANPIPNLGTVTLKGQLISTDPDCTDATADISVNFVNLSGGNVNWGIDPPLRSTTILPQPIHLVPSSSPMDQAQLQPFP